MRRRIVHLYVIRFSLPLPATPLPLYKLRNRRRIFFDTDTASLCEKKSTTAIKIHRSPAKMLIYPTEDQMT